MSPWVKSVSLFETQVSYQPLFRLVKQWLGNTRDYDNEPVAVITRECRESRKGHRFTHFVHVLLPDPFVFHRVVLGGTHRCKTRRASSTIRAFPSAGNCSAFVSNPGCGFHPGPESGPSRKHVNDYWSDAHNKNPYGLDSASLSNSLMLRLKVPAIATPESRAAVSARPMASCQAQQRFNRRRNRFRQSDP